ncbi:MAG: FemAB family PEP-CTERM system-associated protein [Caulobacteraceae bacterium]|nr:FemAB family PEP-CTERM system-associated protein [Caulobacteraceae bacterium]
MSAFVDCEWDAFVEAHPDATFFHLLPWRDLAQDVFGHRPRYLTRREGGTLAAVLPLTEVRSRLFGHALISTAFCVGGGPLATNSAGLTGILQEAERLGREVGVDYIELRDVRCGAQAELGEGWVVRDDLYATFEAPLPASEDENLKQIPRKQRAVVRKALERDLTTTIDSGVDDFFAVYSRTMRDHGTPALPRRFFQALKAAFGDRCEILSVRCEGRPVSSVLSYYFRGRVLPYYTGGAPEARALGSNDLMYWKLMRRAAERGCAVFDFGRSKRGTGPFSFKRNWGFEPRAVAHHYRLIRSNSVPNVNPTNPRYQVMIGAWRRLPLPVANAVSPWLSRSLA